MESKGTSEPKNGGLPSARSIHAVAGSWLHYAGIRPDLQVVDHTSLFDLLEHLSNSWAGTAGRRGLVSPAFS